MKREPFNLKNTLTSLSQAHELLSFEDLFSILQQCRKDGSAEDAKHMHVLLCEFGLEGCAMLGNHLVRVFVESQNLHDADLVFKKLVDRDDDSWTSFMHACIDHGHACYAVELYKQMQGKLSCSSKSLLQTLLKACAKLRDAEWGKQFHFEVINMGLENDTFIGSALVDMYAKSGTMDAAREVFDKMQSRDVVSWTAIISGCVEHGLIDEGFECVNKMQLEGMSPNAVTFVCILKGCGSRRAVDKAGQVHMEAVKQGFEKDFSVTSTLVDVYAKCGSFAEAKSVFGDLPMRDMVLWTALIAAYAEQGYGDEILCCLDQMRQEGASPNAVTYVCSLKVFGDTEDADRVREIHSQLIKQGFENCSSVGGTLVFAYGKCGILEDAHEVLDGMPCQDVFSYNSLILAYVEQGHDHDALNFMEKMQMEGVFADAFTFVCSLKACGRQRMIEKGLLLHARIVTEEFETDPYIISTLVDMYSRCGFFPEAWAVVDETPAHNAVTWTALITGYLENGFFKEAMNCLQRMQGDGIPLDAVTFVCGLKACGGIGALHIGQQLHAELAQEGYEEEPSVGNALVDMYVKCGLLKEAEAVFDELPVQQLLSWTALITGYMDLKLTEQALVIYDRMPLERLSLDGLIFVTALKACGSLGALDKGQRIHAEIAKESFEEDPSINSSLVDMYAKCGSLLEAWEILDGQSVQNIVVWTTLVTGLACQGNSRAVFSVLQRLVDEGVEPDAITLLNVMTVCSHGGMVEKGIRFFKTISQALSNFPTIELCNCLMDLLSRAGQLVESIMVVEEMPFQPNLVTWNTILGACQKLNNVEYGQQAFHCAITLDNKQPAPYISMISIYADAHMWEDVKKIDALREAACTNENF